MSFFEKIKNKFYSTNSEGYDNNKTLQSNNITNESRDSIFKKIYELNGCYKCNLKITGLTLGHYICNVVIMEKELIVFHLINRNNLNIPSILAPVAATAFATSFNNETSGISKGEWIVLPFHHITNANLINNNELSIRTKSGINYIIGNNEECVLKISDIYNEQQKNSSLKKEISICFENKNQFELLNATINISEMELGVNSVKEIAPYSNQFPCCIVSISNKQLAKILTSDLFYAKYILDPEETFNLVISEWDDDNYKLDNNFFFKQGASREVQYKRKIGTGFTDIWVPFNEKHQIFYCKNYSYIHILINVYFVIFEKNICIKILLRIVALKDNKSQLDIECELENTSTLSYLVRHQLENNAISNIKSTIQKYINGIKNEVTIDDERDELIKESGYNLKCKYNKENCKESSVYCNDSICCFDSLNNIINNILNF